MNILAALSLLTTLNSEAVSAWRANDQARAEVLFQLALRRAPAPAADRARVHSNLAALYKRQRRYRLAARHYQHAARLTRPHHAIALNNLAEVRRLQKRPAEAIQLLRLALEILDPASADLPILLHNLAAAQAQCGMRSEARQNLSRALSLGGNALTRRLLSQLDTVPVTGWQQVD